MVLEAALDLLYPPKCVFCRKLLKSGEVGVCASCAEAVAGLAIDRRLKGEFFERGLACFPYEGNVRLSVHRFKFGGRKEYAKVFGRYMTSLAKWDGEMAQCDIVTAPPTNRRNLRSRGYDHAALLARATAEGLGKPYLRALRKARETEAMFSLRPEERRANILGSVKLACKAEQIAGKTVLMTDDIFTTGATAGECSRVLLSAGAAKVLILTFAKASEDAK